MDATVDQLDLIEFPHIEGKTKKRSTLRQMLDAIERHGPLLPQSMMAGALDLSKQRVSQLIEEGKLASVEVAGKHFIPAAALELYLTEEKKAGRPFDPVSRWATFKRITKAIK
jgi:hypothetical protein